MKSRTMNSVDPLKFGRHSVQALSAGWAGGSPALPNCAAAGRSCAAGGSPNHEAGCEYASGVDPVQAVKDAWSLLNMLGPGQATSASDLAEVADAVHSGLAAGQRELMLSWLTDPLTLTGSGAVDNGVHRIAALKDALGGADIDVPGPA